MRRAAVLALIFLASCATGYLPVREARTISPEPLYTLILYGGRFYDDFETTAILDPEGDGYTVEPAAPDFFYRRVEHLGAERAVEAARHFVSAHPSFSAVQRLKVVSREGRTLAYELRPLYQPFAVGVRDALNVYYWTEGNRLRVRVDLVPELERRLSPIDPGRP